MKKFTYTVATLSLLVVFVLSVLVLDKKSNELIEIKPEGVHISDLDLASNNSNIERYEGSPDYPASFAVESDDFLVTSISSVDATPKTETFEGSNHLENLAVSTGKVNKSTPSKVVKISTPVKLTTKSVKPVVVESEVVIEEVIQLEEEVVEPVVEDVELDSITVEYNPIAGTPNIHDEFVPDAPNTLDEELCEACDPSIEFVPSVGNPPSFEVCSVDELGTTCISNGGTMSSFRPHNVDKN